MGQSVRRRPGHKVPLTCFRVEAMGLEPTNLLTASQALYQLSYAPVAALRTASPGRIPIKKHPAAAPAHRVPRRDRHGSRGRAGDRHRSGDHSFNRMK